MSSARSPSNREASLSFDDIVAGMHEFRTTQDVIRSTFKALHDVIKNQGESIRNMQAQLETKLSKAEGQSLLAKKASVDAVNKSLTEVARVLDTKASLQDLESKADLVQVETALAAKASGSEVRALRTSSATIASVDALREHFDHQLERIGHSLADRPETATVKSLLEGKASYVDVRTMLDDKADTAMVTRLLEDKASIKYMQQQLRLKNDRSDAERVESALQSVQQDLAVVNLAMARKADHETVMSCIDERAPISMVEGLTSRVEAVAIAADNQINACARTMDKRCSDLEEALKQHAQKVVDRATDDLRGKIGSDLHLLNQSMQGALDSTVEEIDSAMKQLCRRADVEAALRIKVDRDEFSSTIAGVRETASEMRSRLSSSEDDARREKQRLDLIEGAVAAKAGHEETENKLSTKANIEEVNASIVSVIEELDKKASLQELAVTVKEQALINSTMYHELCVGRWVWKGGITRAGGIVPWTAQATNTDPSNFLWSTDKIYVEVISPGLYELSVGFYSRSKPSITVLVNNEPVMTAIGSTTAKSGSARLVVVPRHSAGIVAGLTHTDFLALPDHARISVAYTGDDRAEAFLSLRKL